MIHTFFLFFILLIFYFHFHPVVSLSSDGLAFLTLKFAVNGDTASAFSEWNENDPTPCHWSGISCANISGESEVRVVGIGLAGKGLRGYLPSELGNLIYLRRLSLHTNLFHGSIPVQLFNATSLHIIFLHGNNLSGNFSPSPVPTRSGWNHTLFSNTVVLREKYLRMSEVEEMFNVEQRRK